jgi:aminopeptidase N
MQEFEYKGQAFSKSNFTIGKVDKHFAPDCGIEPFHKDINLTVDIDQKTATGFVDIHLKGNVDGGQELTLHAVEFYNVKVMSLSGPEVEYRYNGEEIILFWDNAFSAEEIRIIRIAYTLKDPETGLLFSIPTKEQPDLPYYAVTDSETERARYWLPSVDILTVRTTLSFTLTSEKSLKILANGALMSAKENGDGTKTVNWKLDFPCPSYLACFAIGDFTEYVDKPEGDIPLAYYAPKNYTPEQVHLAFDKTGEMLKWMQKKFDLKFPFPKYYQFAARGIGGAMENISLVSWEDKFILNKDLAREFKYITDLINVHEMSHSYFGDAVVSHDFSQVWLKESWATYIESVWLEDTEGLVARDWQLAEESKQYRREADHRYVRPIVTREFDSSWDMFDMHLYPGGAWRLHMLRNEIGDDKFWAGMRDYLKTYSGKTVETLDFMRCMEKSSGKSLGKFFQQWFYEKGYAKLKIKYSYDKKTKIATLVFEQTQEDKDKGIGLFDYPLDVEFVLESGEKSLETIQIAGVRSVLTFKANAEPQTVSIDPYQKMLVVIDFNPGDDMMTKLMNESSSVNAIMQAITTLVKTEKKKNLKAVADYLKIEKFWGLRVHTYHELSKVSMPYAYQLLADALLEEHEPMALESAANAVGAHQSDVARKAISSRLKTGDNPPRGKMALLTALGYQRKDEDIVLLESHLNDEDFREYTRTGVYAGLGNMRSEKALTALLKNVDHRGAFYDDRQFLATALGNIADWVSKEQRNKVIETLTSMLDDENTFVKRSAMTALAQLKADVSIPKITSIKNQSAAMYKPGIQRFINMILGGEPEEKAEKLQKRIEELEDKLSKFDNRLQDIEATK